jgi:hypothetical protein
MSHIPAGGPKSRNVVHPGIRTGVGGRGVHEGGVGQLGATQGNHVTGQGGRETPYRGEQFYSGRNFQPVELGNKLATNVGPGGCGTGRALYGKAGSQRTHGATNPGSPVPNAQRDAAEQE